MNGSRGSPPEQILRREVTCHVKDILRKETY